MKFFTVDTERMRLDASGNLGLGTSTPFGKLSVNVTSGAPATSGNMTNALTVHNTDGGRAIQLGVNESAALTFINSGYVNNAGIAQPIAFYTGGVEKMRLTSAGNLGLGTATPQLPLHIEGATGSQVLISAASDSVGTTAGILLRAEAGESNSLARVKSAIFFERIAGTYGNGDLKFAVNSDANNNTVTVADTKMTINSSGNVGIGSAPISGARLTLGTGALANEILSFAPATGGSAEFRNTSSTGFFKWTNNDGGSEKMRLTSTGDVEIKTGSIKVETAGQGIYLSLIHISEPTRPY